MSVSVDVNAEEVGGTLDAAIEALLTRAVAATAAARHITDAQISVTLLGDAAIAELNRRFLSHEGPTDVIAFALYEHHETPVGDVYVGFEQAVRQAADHGIPVEQELARLAVHGTLHVLGEEHPEGEERMTSPMWSLQERIVSGLFE